MRRVVSRETKSVYKLVVEELRELKVVVTSDLDIAKW